MKAKLWKNIQIKIHFKDMGMHNNRMFNYYNSNNNNNNNKYNNNQYLNNNYNNNHNSQIQAYNINKC